MIASRRFFLPYPLLNLPGQEPGERPGRFRVLAESLEGREPGDGGVAALAQLLGNLVEPLDFLDGPLLVFGPRLVLPGSAGELSRYPGSSPPVLSGLTCRFPRSLGGSLCRSLIGRRRCVESLLPHEFGEASLHRLQCLVQRLVLALPLPHPAALVQRPDERAVRTLDPELDPAIARGPAGDRRVDLAQGGGFGPPSSLVTGFLSAMTPPRIALGPLAPPGRL